MRSSVAVLNSHNIKNYSKLSITRIYPLHCTGQSVKRKISMDRFYRYYLVQSQQRADCEAVAMVEICHEIIKNQIETYFKPIYNSLPIYAVNLLQNKIVKQDFFAAIISNYDLQLLLQSIKKSLQKDIVKQFGGPATEIAIFDYKLNVNDINNFIEIAEEYQNTIRVSQKAAEACSRAYKDTVDKFPTPFLWKRIYTDKDAANYIMKIVDCQPQRQMNRCQEAVERRLNGIILNVYQDLYRQLCRLSANVCYSIFDDRYRVVKQEKEKILKIKLLKLLTKKEQIRYEEAV